MAACAAERNGMQSNNKRPVPTFLSASVLLLLVLGWEHTMEKITSRQGNTMPLKDGEAPKLHPENA